MICEALSVFFTGLVDLQVLGPVGHLAKVFQVCLFMSCDMCVSQDESAQS